MKKQILTSIALIIFSIGLVKVVNKTFYSPYSINVKSTAKSLDKALRIFNSKDLKKSTDMYIYPQQSHYTLVNQEIWGFCLLKGSNITSITNDKNINIPLTQHGDTPECDKRTQIIKMNNIVTNKFTLVSKLFSCLLLIFTMIFATFIYKELKGIQFFKKQKLYRPLIITFFVTMTLYYLCVFPGLFDTDVFHTIRNVHNLHAGSWFTVFNDLLFSAALNFHGKIAWIGFLFYQYYFLIYLVFLICAYRIKMPKKYIILTTLALLMFPSALNALYISRDGLICMSIIMICLLLLNYVTKKDKHISWQEMIIFAILVSLISCLRRETLLTAFCATCFFFLVFELDKKKTLMMILTLMFFQGAIGLTTFLMTHKDDQSVRVKNLTSLSMIISEMFNKNYSTSTKEEDIKIIGKYYHVNILKKFYSDNHVKAVYNGAIKEKQPKSMNELSKVIKRMLFENPWLFFKSRIVLMNHLLLVSDGKTILPRVLNYIPSQPLNDETRIANTSNLYEESDTAKTFKPFYSFGNKLISLYFTTPQFRVLFTFIPSFIVMFIAFLFFKRAPITAMMGVICFVRVPVFFVLAPAAQMKYLYDFYLYGLIFFPILIWEIKSRETSFLLIRTNKLCSILFYNFRFLRRKESPVK